MKNKNEYKYYLQTALWNTVLMMINGSVIQACMLEFGIGAEHVSFFVSAMQIIQVVVMLMISKYTEKIKNIISVYSVTCLIQLMILVVMLVMCYVNRISIDIKYYIIFVVGIVANVALGVNNVIAYKLPYHIIDMNRYGLVTGVSGTCCGIVGIVFSAILAFFLEMYTYISVIKVFYVVAILFGLITALVVMSYKDNGYKGSQNNNVKINLFRYKPFTVLFIPNILRGFNSGVVLLMLTIGYHIKVIDSVSSGYLVVITNAAMILSCTFYSYISKFNKDKWIILVSSGIMAVFMPIMCMGRSTTIFLVVYAIVYFVFNLISYSVPVLVTIIVDYEMIGQYSAWRMMLHTLGGAIAGVLCVPMIDTLGVGLTLAIIGLMQFVSGGIYCIYALKNGR